MADEQTKPDETTGTTGSQNDQPPPETGKDGQQFDAARAMSTIEKLRDEIKTLKGTSKEADTLRAKLKEIEDKDKSEAEKATSAKAEAEQKLSETQGRLRNMAIRVAVAESASAAGIAPENVKAALRLLDADAIEMDDDGEPKNVEAALKALVKEFPILAGAGDTRKTAERGTPGTPKPSGNPSQQEVVDDKAKKLQATGAYPRF